MTGFQSPNHTQTPNDLFDDLLPLMEFAELKVVLHAIRRTFGFHKDSDEISLTQFEKATGLSRQGVIDGIAAAQARGVMIECGEGKRGVKRYRLVISSDQSTELTSSSQVSRPVSGATSPLSRHTKEIKTKETPKRKAAAPARVASAVIAEPDPQTPAAAAEPPNIFELYHGTFGRLVSNPILADELKDIAATYPVDWIQDAFREAALANATSHKYALRCLERWQREGRDAKARDKPATPKGMVPSKRPPTPAHHKPAAPYDPTQGEDYLTLLAKGELKTVTEIPRPRSLEKRNANTN